MIHPIQDKILIEPIEATKQSESGLFVAGDQQSLERGTVVSVGEGVYTSTGVLINPPVGETDVVFYPRFAGTEHVENGNKYVLLNSQDIVAIDLD